MHAVKTGVLDLEKGVSPLKHMLDHNFDHLLKVDVSNFIQHQANRLQKQAF